MLHAPPGALRLRRWPPLAVALLGLLGVALFAPSFAQAQEPPATFDENGVLTTPPGEVFIDNPSNSTTSIARCLEVEFLLTIAGQAVNEPVFCIYNNALFIYGSGTKDTAVLNLYKSDPMALTFELYSEAGTLLYRRGGASTAVGWADVAGLSSLTIGSVQVTHGLTYRTTANAFGRYNDIIASTRAYLVVTMHSDSSIFASDANSDIPAAPDSVLANRGADGTSATVTWDLVGPVVEYEILREQAITIEAMTTATTQYGNAQRFLVPGTVWGLDSYTDATTDPKFTYRYRVRARRGANKWGSWSAYAVAGGQSAADIGAPGGFQAIRAQDNANVVLSWTAPSGEVDGYAVQRQELVVAEGSTIFANPVILTDSLSSDTLTYTDASIAPGRTYEYRVTPLEGDAFGKPTEWARVSPFTSRLGGAPPNFRFDLARDRKLADRREFWMVWDEVDGADDYEVEVFEYDRGSRGESLSSHVVTDPSFFRTIYGTVNLRVRARKSDAGLCGSEAGDHCHSDWTGWYGVQFAPESPQTPSSRTSAPDPSVEELREDVNELLDSTLDQSGVDVNPGIAIQFGVLVGTVIVSSASIWASWRRGMRALGMGMAFSSMVISLYLGHVLLDIPAAWPIGGQALVSVLGIIAFARQIGAFR